MANLKMLSWWKKSTMQKTNFNSKACVVIEGKFESEFTKGLLCFEQEGEAHVANYLSDSFDLVCDGVKIIREDSDIEDCLKYLPIQKSEDYKKNCEIECGKHFCAMYCHD